MKYHRQNYDIDKICPLWTDYQVVKLVKPNSKVLEIGCATGYIGKYLKEKVNCESWGVEIDPDSAEMAKPYYQKILVGNIENEQILQQIDRKFDFILCMNVLEHLVNPLGVLQKIKKFLAPAGRVIITLPNIAHFSIRVRLLFGKFDYEDYGILDNTHLRFFTLKTAKEMIESSGLKIEHLSIDPDKGIPRFHGVFLRIPGGWKFLKKIYSLCPTLFGYQFIFVLTDIGSKGNA
ncbi:MAG: class I SAM-dependent methyltransferase [Elusimicrobiota bacterium]